MSSPLSSLFPDRTAVGVAHQCFPNGRGTERNRKEKKRPRDARWKYHGGEEGRAGIEKGARGGYGDASVDRGGEEESSMKAA